MSRENEASPRKKSAGRPSHAYSRAESSHPLTNTNQAERGASTYTYPCGYYYFSQVKWKLVTAGGSSVGPRIDNSYRFHPC